MRVKIPAFEVNDFLNQGVSIWWRTKWRN